jgi:hypothetical protein
MPHHPRTLGPDVPNCNIRSFANRDRRRSHRANYAPPRVAISNASRDDMASAPFATAATTSWRASPTSEPPSLDADPSLDPPLRPLSRMALRVRYLIQRQLERGQWSNARFDLENKSIS